MLCPTCGTPLADGDRFCAACGNVVPTAAPQQPDAAPQPQQYAAPQPPQYTAPQPQQYAAPQPQQYAAPQPQQYAAPQPQQYAAPQPQQYAAPQPQQYAAPQPQQYAAQPYGYAQPQAAVQTKAKKKLLLPLIIGAIVLLIGVFVLLDCLVFHLIFNKGSDNAVQTDPQQIAEEVLPAYYVNDYDKVAPYTQADLYEELKAHAVDTYGSEQNFYDTVNAYFGTEVTDIHSAYKAIQNDINRDYQEDYGSDYVVSLTLKESECITLDEASVADWVSENRGRLMLDGADLMHGVDVSSISELRGYYYDLLISGSKDSYSTWYIVYLAKINGTWKVIGIY